NSINTAQPTSTPTSIPQPIVVSLTFDDGDADNFDIRPLLKTNGLHATFYIPSGLVGTQGYMTWDQLKTLQEDGNEIGGHTFDHTTVRGLDAEALKHQICDDHTNLIEHGFNPISFAYPHGSYDVNAQQMVKDCGYTSARGVHDGPDSIPPSDLYALQALPYIVDDTDLAKIERYINGTRTDGGGWVILIFHHVCDSCDYFSVKPDVINGFIPWLAKQQAKGNLKVMTVGEVISGGVSP
ncbi:MAG TPA: polysaccharide deacetylase family protein, partial [Anaerolineales bacterium]|nr:polysaccharide deacetylase family protein [Anaerolineales bacterium]